MAKPPAACQSTGTPLCPFCAKCEKIAFSCETTCVIHECLKSSCKQYKTVIRSIESARLSDNDLSEPAGELYEQFIDSAYNSEEL